MIVCLTMLIYLIHTIHHIMDFFSDKSPPPLKDTKSSHSLNLTVPNKFSTHKQPLKFPVESRIPRAIMKDCSLMPGVVSVFTNW